MPATLQVGITTYTDWNNVSGKDPFHHNRTVNTGGHPDLVADVDYFRVRLENQVDDLDIGGLLRDEADCRIGETQGGTPVDINTPTCLDALARVKRFSSGVFAGELASVAINPVNTSLIRTSGIDVAINARLPTERIGTFSLSASHTHVFNHTFRQYPGDPVLSKLAFDSGFYIPRDKSTASLTWAYQKAKWTLEGRRLGKLPN
jgi:hypothetical protein